MNRSESQDARDPLSTLSRATARVVQRTERSLSPWVQRALGRAGLSGDLGQARNNGLAGAAAQRSSAIFERIQRVATRGDVWNRQAESLAAPAHATDRFSGAVVQRFPDTSAKFERQSTGSLARNSAPAAATASPATAAETPGAPEIPGSEAMGEDIPSATFQEIRERIQRAQRGGSGFPDFGTISSAPNREAPSAPFVQRSAAPAQPSPSLPPNFNRMPSDEIARPTRAERMRIRRFAHIEEVTSGPGLKPASPAADQASETNAAGGPEDAESRRPASAPLTTGPEHRVQRSAQDRADAPSIQRKPASEPGFRPLPKPAAAAAAEAAIEPERHDSEPAEAAAAIAPASSANSASPAVQRSIDASMPLVSAPAAPEAERADAASGESATPIAPAPGARVQRKPSDSESDDAGAPPVIRATNAPMPVARPTVSRVPAAIQREGEDEPGESSDDESDEGSAAAVSAAEPSTEDSSDSSTEGIAEGAESSDTESSEDDGELPLRRSVIQRSLARSPERETPATSVPSTASAPGIQRASASVVSGDRAPSAEHNVTEPAARASTANASGATVQRTPAERVDSGSTNSITGLAAAPADTTSGAENAAAASEGSPRSADSTATAVKSAVNEPLPLRVQRSVDAATGSGDVQTSNLAAVGPELSAPLAQDDMPIVRRAEAPATSSARMAPGDMPSVRRVVDPSAAAEVASHDAEPVVRRASAPSTEQSSGSASEPAGKQRSSEDTAAVRPSALDDMPVIQRSIERPSAETTKSSAANSDVPQTSEPTSLPTRSSGAPAAPASEGSRTADISESPATPASIQRSIDQAMPLHSTQAAGAPELSSTHSAGGEATPSIQRTSSDVDSEGNATPSNVDRDPGGTVTPISAAYALPISQTDGGEPSVRRQVDQAMPLRASAREASGASAVTEPALEPTTADATEPIIRRSIDDGGKPTNPAPMASVNRPNNSGFRKLPPPTAIQRTPAAASSGERTGEQANLSASPGSTAPADAVRSKTVQRAADPGMPVRARPRVSRPARESSAGTPEASATSDQVIQRQSLPATDESSATAGGTPPTTASLSRLAPLRPAVQRSTDAAASDVGQTAGAEGGRMGSRDSGTHAPQASAVETTAAPAVQRQPRAHSSADYAASEAPLFGDSAAHGSGTTAERSAPAPAIQRMPAADSSDGRQGTAMPLVRTVGRAAPQATGTVQREIRADELAAQILGKDMSAPAPMRGARPGPESMTLRRMPLTIASPVIQRAPQTVTYISPMASNTGVLQRADDAKPGTTISPIAKKDAKKDDKKEEPKDAAAGAPDLDTLARQILPLLKRMLVVERERHVRR